MPAYRQQQGRRSKSSSQKYPLIKTVLVIPSSSSVTAFAVIFCIFLSHNVASVRVPTKKTTLAVFTFGDSTLDTGNNDYIITFSKRNFNGWRGPNPYKLISNASFSNVGVIFSTLQLKFASKFIQEISMPPIGCVPGQKTAHGGIERACYETENQAAGLFNSKLSSLIDSLNKRLPEAKLIYIDSYNPLLSMIQNPAKYGFEVVDKGCCGTIVSLPVCAKYSTDTCNDASKYIFWDGYHPTETTYRMPTSIIEAS